MKILLKSPCGHELLLNHATVKPTITVERYYKWYEMFLVSKDDGVREITTEDWEKHANTFKGTTWGDHIPNPLFVKALAESNGWEIDPLSYEVIVGRWVIEHENKY